MSSPREHTLATLETLGAVAVLRLQDAARLRAVLDALAAGGIGAAEITMTTAGALEALAQTSAAVGTSVLVGAGSVLDAETARAAIAAGARFVVSPTCCPSLVGVCRRYGVVAILGGLTPTEVCTAWEAGADLVKIFPAGVMGPGYLKELRGPMPHLRLMPTGGVTAENAGAFLAAGAVVVGVGSALVDRDLVAREDYPRIVERSRRLSSAVQAARARPS